MTTKEETIRKVLERRMSVIEDHILNSTTQTPMNKAYYQGKRDGYLQAYELIGETLESIRIELCPV